MRGMVAGEAIQSQAGTDEFREGYERTFGDRKPQRGRWVMTPKGLIPADEYVPEALARDAPIMMDRFYENTAATDGTDIGSRRKHRQYMKEHGVTTADDFKGQWKQAQERREAVKHGHLPDPKRREALERAMYKLSKP